MSRQWLLAISLFLAAALGLVIQNSQAHDMAARLARFDFEMPTGFQLIGESTISVKDRDLIELKATGPDGAELSLLVVPGVEHSGDYTEQKMFEINSVYGKNQSPYPGAVSDKLACSEDFMPRFEETTQMVKVRLFANRRRQLGACSDSEAAYDAYVFIVKCQQTVFDFLILKPKGSAPPPLESFRCRT